MGRRARQLSAEERRLWEEVARSAVPMPGRVRPATPEVQPAASEEGKPITPVAPAHAPRPSAVPRLGSAGLARREARALARGRASPDGTIDLHGMSQAEAHVALARFVRSSHAAGRVLLLVVTGKGRPVGPTSGSLAERGVLRRMVPHWLALPELSRLVVGFEEAGPRQGGGGALYVRLRRRG